MSWFPQIGAGSVAQFPLRRTRKWRAIRNHLESGEQIVLPDGASGLIEWRLAYRDLNDAETQSIKDLFASSQGTYRAFGFADPTANLLGWSEDLSRPDWQKDLLTVVGGILDPAGGQNGWTLANGTPGWDQISQTVALSGDYVGCFSLYARADVSGSIILQRDGTSATVPVGPAWTRVWINGTGVPGAVSSTMSVQLYPGQTINLWGLQFESQPYPSEYKKTGAAFGIYEETYFGADELTFTSTSEGLSACEITLVSRT